jgi:hypothetical protein
MTKSEPENYDAALRLYWPSQKMSWPADRARAPDQKRYGHAKLRCPCGTLGRCHIQSSLGCCGDGGRWS